MKAQNNWIAHEGSGHNFLAYVILICSVSVVSALIFGPLSAGISGLYQVIAITLP